MISASLPLLFPAGAPYRFTHWGRGPGKCLMRRPNSPFLFCDVRVRAPLVYGVLLLPGNSSAVAAADTAFFLGFNGCYYSF